MELRHDATHDELPSYDLLRNVGHLAVQWLYENYWQKQRETVDEWKILILEQLICYRNEAKGFDDPKDQPPVTLQLKKLTSFLQQKENVSLQHSPSLFVEVLLDGNLFIGNPIASASKQKEKKKLPKKLKLHWIPVLQVLSTHWEDFLNVLIMSILHQLAFGMIVCSL